MTSLFHPILRLVCLAAALGSAGGGVFAGSYRGECDIVFRGDSTLHKFEGRAKAEPFIATVSRDEHSGQVLFDADVNVPVPGMSTAHEKRDRNMREMFAVTQWPAVRGCIARAPKPAGASATTVLRLTIKGQEQSVPMQVSDWKEQDGTVTCKIGFQVSLKQSGLHPPSVLGIIRVSDTVAVEGVVRLTPQSKP